MNHFYRTQMLWLGASVLALAGCAAEEPYEKPPVPVQIADVGRQRDGQTLLYSATVEPGRRVDLAFRVGGYVTSLAQIDGRVVQDGDRVTAGTVLASVRVDDYDAKVAQARAGVAEADAARDAAGKALARAEALFATRSLTRPELEQARAAVAAIDAKGDGGRAVVREAELAREDSHLRAPLTGQVLKRLVEVGSLVGPGTGAFVLADMRTAKVVIGVPDTMLARFRTGARQRVVSEALPDRALTGRVTKVSPTADPRSRMFEVELTLANDDGALKPGMVATVHVGGDGGPAPAEVLTLPLSALVRAPGGDAAYAVFLVEDRDGVSTARIRRVTLGPLSGNAVVVLDGVQGGERVIVRGASLVADGERVNPTR